HGAAFVLCFAMGAVAVAEAAPPGGGSGKVGPSREPDDEKLARDLKNVVLEYVRGKAKTVSAKEAIGAMAAVVGERCIYAAGEYPARSHKFVPGQRVFSDKVNVLLVGDIPNDDIEAVPASAVFGVIRDGLAGTAFRAKDFPPLAEIFRGFAGRV